MVDVAAYSETGRNIGVYAIGVGLVTAGALGLADAIALPIAAAGGFFALGLLFVLFVHERWGGPI